MAFYLTTILVSSPVFGTAGVTNALVYEMFGGWGAGLILGLAFALHQVGGFLGTLSGGVVFDRTGDYTFMFLFGVVLLFSSAVLSSRVRILLLVSPAPGLSCALNR
jgi:predicted MFS family arabinose efflux permease